MVVSSASLISAGFHEKRKHKRILVSWKVTGEFAGRKAFSVKTINISESGLLLHMPRLVENKTRTYIKVHAFIGGKNYIIDGIVEFKHSVISNDQFHSGVEFIKINDRNRALLKACVNGVSPESVTVKKKDRDLDDILGLGKPKEPEKKGVLTDDDLSMESESEEPVKEIQLASDNDLDKE